MQWYKRITTLEYNINQFIYDRQLIINLKISYYCKNTIVNTFFFFANKTYKVLYFEARRKNLYKIYMRYQNITIIGSIKSIIII